MRNVIHNKRLWRYKGEFCLQCILPVTSDIDYLHFDSSSPATIIPQDKLFCSTLNWMLSNADPLQLGLDFLKIISCRREWAFSVGISTEKIFLWPTASRPALGLTQHPIQWVATALSPGVKRPRRQADHLHLVSKSWWSYTSISPYVFVAWCLSADTNFTFIGDVDDTHTKKNKLRGFSPQANYTDRVTAACRGS
jgi:hypothetical protein